MVFNDVSNLVARRLREVNETPILPRAHTELRMIQFGEVQGVQVPSDSLRKVPKPHKVQLV